MSKGLVESITELFKPQAPLWSCELTSKHVIVTGVNSSRSRIVDKLAADLPSDKNPETMRSYMRQALAEAGFKGSEIAIVVPDSAVRIALITAEKPSRNAEEQRTFIRWKLKKSTLFDVDSAQLAYRVLGPHRGGSGVDMLVVLSPKSVVQEYEVMFEPLGIHAGLVLPSTLAALNLLAVPARDSLFVKVAPDCVTTTVFQNQRAQFYRRVTDVSVYDAIYPTVLYYQDKLGGTAFESLYICGYNEDLRRSLEEIREKIGLVPQQIGPQTVDDIYKPALGAIHLKPGVL